MQMLQDQVLAGHVLTFGRSCLAFEREVLAEECPPRERPQHGEAHQTGTGQRMALLTRQDSDADAMLRSHGAIAQVTAHCTIPV